MATFERDYLESYAPGQTVDDVVANFGSAQDYWRIYRYRQPGQPPGTYSHYAALSAPAEETAMNESEHVLEPTLVWQNPKPFDEIKFSLDGKKLTDFL